VWSANTDLVVNGRHYIILKIEGFNVAEGWASYEVLDTQTQFQFRVAEFRGANALLETAQRKAEKLARLKTPGIPLVHAVVLEKGKLFIFTDSIQGYTLREYLVSRSGPAKDDVVAMVEYGRRLCAILSRLHPNFVHRGLRPENIIVTGKRVLLTDLGFAFMPREFEREKLLYRAPEQTLAGCGERIGCRTDIYGFGLIFGEMLTGKCLSLTEHQMVEDFQGWGQYDKPSMTWQEIPGELQDIVMHCTQTMPTYRPEKIEDVKRKLLEWLLFRKGELMGIADESARNFSAVPSHACPGKPKLSSPLHDRYYSTCGRFPRGRNNWIFEPAATSEGKEEPVPDSWFSRIGPNLGSFDIKAMLRVSMGERRETGVKQYTNLDTNKHGRQRVKRIAIKRGVGVLILLFLLLQPSLLKRVYQFNWPAAPIILQTAVVKLDPSVERQELFNKLSSKSQEFNSLMAAYQNAKIPGSPEKTAQNFRDVESSAQALHQSMSNIIPADIVVTEVLTMEIEMVDTLKDAAGIFAEYLEGTRKITGSLDWVAEADLRYWKALEIQAQVAVKLNNLKMQP
jgi:serine/threonine protein kinase